MGKKKQYIDKRNATTYHVVYRSAADAEADPLGGDYDVLSAEELLRKRAAEAENAANQHPLDWLRDREADYVKDDAQRNELLSLGFPDDGYNYLQHLRAINVGRGAVYAAAGEPSTSRPDPEDLPVIDNFVEPEPDVAFIDARGLVVDQAASNDADIEHRLLDISAFARRLEHTSKIEKSKAVKEVDEVLAALEDFDDSRAEAAAAVLGEGDLLDDFVLEASQAPREPTGRPDVDCASERDDEAEEEEWDSDLESDDASDAAADEDGRLPGVPGQRRGGSSIASSFWRPARQDRTDALSIIDERFERLALEYDDDEIGDLEEEAAATRPATCFENDENVQRALDDYIRRYRKGNEVVDLPVGVTLGDMTAEQIEQLDDELVAKLKAKEAYLRQQAAEEAGGADDGLELVEVRARPQWDCQSVLSLTSNLENHPARIADEPSARRKLRAAAAAAGAGALTPIQLSAKSGLPLGVAGVTRRERFDACDAQTDASENLGAARTRDESSEEKRARKAQVKQARRVARTMKKELKLAYSTEQVKAQKHATTNVQANASITRLP